MRSESALLKVLESSPELRTAWETPGAEAQFEVLHAIDSDTLSACVITNQGSQPAQTHASVGQFDPARLPNEFSAWQLWPECGLDEDEQITLRTMLEALDYTDRRREAARQLGHAVDLHHPRTIAMRALTRRWAEALDPQLLLEKSQDADTAAAMLDTVPMSSPTTCLVDEATLYYLAVKPRIGAKTTGIPLGATGFREAFDLSLILELQGVACYDQGVDQQPAERTYRGRQNFSIPLLSFDLAHPEKSEQWRPHLNYAVVTEEQQSLLHTALTSLSVWHGKNDFSAQFCGVLTERELSK